MSENKKTAVARNDEVRLIEIERTAKTIFVLARRWLKLMKNEDIKNDEVPEVQIMHKHPESGIINYFKLIIDVKRKRLFQQQTTLSQLRNLEVKDLIAALQVKRES